MDNITLIGMPGSGKSTVGVILAKALGCRFLDTDLLIQERHGALLQELLDRHGPEKFLDMEADVISSVSCENTVIAPGGSCVLRESGIAHLRELGKIIYLRLSLPTLQERLTNLATRGIAFAPGQTLGDVYRQRAPLYEKWADVTVDADGQTTGETLAAVLRAISE